VVDVEEDSGVERRGGDQFESEGVESLAEHGKTAAEYERLGHENVFVDQSARGRLGGLRAVS
jgi:hypothetical protein